MLIIFAGLQGSGKTTLARALAYEIGALYLRVDTIENAMQRSVLKIYPTEDAGYLVGYAVAEDNLRLGRQVVADSVNPIDITRSAWLDVAARTGQKAVEVEVICSDPIEHRRRIETREADLPDQKLPTWQAVLNRGYHPWNRDHIVIDTAQGSAEECVKELLTRLPEPTWSHSSVRHSNATMSWRRAIKMPPSQRSSIPYLAISKLGCSIPIMMFPPNICHTIRRIETTASIITL